MRETFTIEAPLVGGGTLIVFLHQLVGYKTMTVTKQGKEETVHTLVTTNGEFPVLIAWKDLAKRAGVYGIIKEV